MSVDPWEDMQQLREEMTAEAMRMAEEQQLEAARQAFGLSDEPLTGWNEKPAGD